MRGLDKALEEVQAARNRVSRLYGLGRLNKDDMMAITDSLQKTAELIVKSEERNNPSGVLPASRQQELITAP